MQYVNNKQSATNAKMKRKSFLREKDTACRQKTDPRWTNIKSKFLPNATARGEKKEAVLLCCLGVKVRSLVQCALVLLHFRGQLEFGGAFFQYHFRQLLLQVHILTGESLSGHSQALNHRPHFHALHFLPGNQKTNQQRYHFTASSNSSYQFLSLKFHSYKWSLIYTHFESSNQTINHRSDVRNDSLNNPSINWTDISIHS